MKKKSIIMFVLTAALFAGGNVSAANVDKEMFGETNVDLSVAGSPYDYHTEISFPLEVGKDYTIDGYVYRASSIKEFIFLKPAKKSVKEVIIPDGIYVDGGMWCPVVKVAPKACYNCKKLDKVVLGFNVKEIGNQAFAKCPQLEKVTLSKSLTTIGKKCFYKDKKLKHLVAFETNLKKVGKDALKGTPKNNVKTIEKNRKKFKKLFGKTHVSMN